MKISAFILTICALIVLGGCADIELPTPQQVIKTPIGTDSVKVGMTKNHVKELWGGPDRITYVNIKDGDSSRARELWYYKSFAGIIPVNADYLSKPKYVYFDGNNVTNVSDTPLETVSEE